MSPLAFDRSPEEEAARRKAREMDEWRDRDRRGDWQNGEDQKPAAALSATQFTLRNPADIPPREFLYGRHLIRRYPSTTVSPGGIGKSALTIAEALAMVSGRNLLGVPVYGRALRVWLWNLEDGHDELERRIAAACQHYGLSAADLGDRLFVDSGRNQTLCTAVQNRDGTQILRPVIDALTTELTDRGIDVLTVDPFVSSHAIPENDNSAMDMVVKECWGHVAERANCAIELVDHTRKTYGGETTAEDSRGAKAKTDAFREVRTLNRMGSDLGADYGVENHRLYFRAYSDKANHAPPPDTSDWYRLVNVELANGDHVGVVERWQPPDAWDGVTTEHLRDVQRRVAEGEWREAPQSPDWVGCAVAEALELDIHDPAARKRITKLLRMWTANRMFRTVERPDAQRKLRKFVAVGEPA